MYDLEKERFTLDTDKHLSCRRLRIIAESYATKGLYAYLLCFAYTYLVIYLVHIIYITLIILFKIQNCLLVYALARFRQECSSMLLHLRTF